MREERRATFEPVNGLEKALLAAFTDSSRMLPYWAEEEFFVRRMSLRRGGEFVNLNDVAAEAKALEGALDSIVRCIEDALAEYEREPKPAFSYAYKKWRDTALCLLAADLQTVRSHLSPTDAEGLKALLAVGENEIGLAKNLDTFRFDFAGESFEEALRKEVRKTVHTASDLVRAIAELQ